MNVFTGAVCQTATTGYSLDALPIQFMARASNFEFSIGPVTPMIGSTPIWFCTPAITVPSFGEELARVFMATRLPAAGRFCTTMEGLPGIYFGM